jgi:multidrug efflux pump subunit AcrA (membrane-fusion protein)
MTFPTGTVTALRRLASLWAAALLFAGCTGVQLPTGGTPLPAQQAATSTPIPTAPAVARPTYIVQRGDVQETLKFTGRWQPRDQTLLAFDIAGTVRRVQVRTGDTVQAGQLLADYQIQTLEDSLTSAQNALEVAKIRLENGSVTGVGSVADAEVALANARLSLERTKLGNPWTGVASAKISLENAQNSLRAAERDYDDVISKANNPPSAVNGAYDKLIAARNALRTAQISYDSAAQSYATYQYQIAQAENAIIQSQLNLEKAKRGAGDPTLAQAVTDAQLKVTQLQNQIKQSSLYAPSDGEVLSVIIKPGDQVKAFDTVITIGRANPKEVIASIAIGDAQKLSVGLVGIAQVVNRPETAVQCIVRRIPQNARDADQTTRVAASFDNLATGTLIEVEMPLQVRRNVLWLPPAAVRTFQNRSFVVLQLPDGVRSVDVTVGLRTTDRVEIQSGVNEGDIVVAP